jgi:dTDP-L-rhamnose 4-epimerase
VDDVVEALLKALSAEAPHGTVVDIGSADPVTIEQVARKLMALYGRPTDAYRVTGDFRAGDIRHAVADVTKAREVLGWTPRVGIDEGLAALARWCVAEKQEMEKQEAELSGR